MKPTKGFTLIELMVVITIIALLLTMLLPGIAKALEIARRAKCMANMDGIADGLATMEAKDQMYGNGAKGYPWAKDTIGDAPHLRSGSQGSVRIKNPWGDDTAPEYPVSTNMYSLIHLADVEPGVFVCPSTSDIVDDGILDNDGKKYWDFKTNENLSYSYQAPLVTAAGREVSPFVNTVPGVVVLSDQNPIGQPTVLTDGQPDGSGDGGARTWEEFDSTEPTQSSSSAMSANHRGESINVLKYDGSVTSSFRANIGYDEDCIWTPGGSSNITGTRWENATYQGSVDLKGGVGYDVFEHKNSRDTFLIDSPENPANL